jgi:hypothetical protein
MKSACPCRCGRGNRRICLLGRRFGQLVVVKLDHIDGGACWMCLCDCGTKCVVRRQHLLAKKEGTVSCGCFSRTQRTTHGMRHSPEYGRHRSMLNRCYNQNEQNFPWYGGAKPPITVCDRWRGENGFENFLADLGKRPSPKHSLGRYLDSGNYEPGNVAWQTRAEQSSEQKGKTALLRLRNSRKKAA